MARIDETQALTRVTELLADLLGHEPRDLRVEPYVGGRHGKAFRPDLTVSFGPFRLLVEWKGGGSAATVARAVRQLERYAGDEVIPLVAVTYMGATSRRICEEAEIGWIDLAGNAYITAPGLRIRCEGQPNRFKSRGRPSSAFAPKSSRLARWFLLHPEEAISQRELARTTEMDEGFTSRIVKRLEKDDLITRQASGTVKVRDPQLLLRAWAQVYDFGKHHIVRGHVAARSGESLLRSTAERLDRLGVEYAATGLGAAWLYTHFAAFRLVTLYLREPCQPSLLREIDFREESRGSNLWLVRPNDEGVFHGAGSQEGIHCVSPIQAYLDLGQHPERAVEAAARLGDCYLPWRSND